MQRTPGRRGKCPEAEAEADVGLKFNAKPGEGNVDLGGLYLK